MKANAAILWASKKAATKHNRGHVPSTVNCIFRTDSGLGWGQFGLGSGLGLASGMWREWVGNARSAPSSVK